MEAYVKKDDLQQGRELLARPVLPLVSMVQFLFLTGPFATVAEVIDELPEPIETGYAVYEQPRRQLGRYLALLRPLEEVKRGIPPSCRVVDEEGADLDGMTAITSLVLQQVLAAELEEINSLLCAPCGCTLCCIGPDSTMAQEFFEIPLQEQETALFSTAPRFESAELARHRAMDEEAPRVDGRPFYAMQESGLFRWQNGWSLILPRATRCPNLEESGRCRVYADRPAVCRRPQIFPYVLEPLEGGAEGEAGQRLRRALLAVVDCPYVQALRDEIAAYGAACELDVIFRQNKS